MNNSSNENQQTKTNIKNIKNKMKDHKLNPRRILKILQTHTSTKLNEKRMYFIQNLQRFIFFSNAVNFF